MLIVTRHARWGQYGWWLVGVLLSAAGAAWTVWAVAAGGLGSGDRPGALSFGVGVVSLVVGAVSMRVGMAALRLQQADLDLAVKALAGQVQEAELEQRAQLLGEGGHRIDVLFRRHHEPGASMATVAVEGRLTTAMDFYRGLRPGRLVITGDPGAGKTMLALELALGLLDRRGDRDPVPLRVSMSGWTGRQPLTDWLTEQILDGLQDRGISASMASTLVRQRRVLPVLDGLDDDFASMNASKWSAKSRQSTEIWVHDLAMWTGEWAALGTGRHQSGP